MSAWLQGYGMLRLAVLAGAALMATTAMASAETYNIQLDGYCVLFSFSVSKSMVVGQSYGTREYCAGGYIAGTVVTVSSAVPPQGRDISFSWNGGPFSNPPQQYTFYLNTGNHYWSAYATADGKTQSAIVGTWSSLPSDAARPSADLPSLGDVLRKRLQHAAP